MLFCVLQRNILQNKLLETRNSKRRITIRATSTRSKQNQINKTKKLKKTKKTKKNKKKNTNHPTMHKHKKTNHDKNINDLDLEHAAEADQSSDDGS